MVIAKVHNLIPRICFIAALTTGAAVSAWALTVAIGWHLHLIHLIQLRPQHAPTQFNAALGLLAGGIGLMALTLGARRVAILCGALSGLLGALTLAQYGFGTSLGIDTLFIDPYLNVRTSTPGRMAPNAALCLVLTGLALAGFASRKTIVSGMSGIACMLSGALALLAVTGYATDVTMAYGWFAFTQMAPLTALAFTALNLALGWHCYRIWSVQPFLRWIGRPVLFAVVMLTMTSAVWLSLLNAERVQLQRAGKDEMEKLIVWVTGPVEQRIEALKRMRLRWEFQGGTPRAEWEADASAHQEEPGFLRAIEWVDPERVIRWVVPRQGNQGALNVDLGAELNGLAALEAARAKRALTVTHVIALPQGGNGFMAIHPIFVGERLDGFIVGVFQVNALLDRAVKQDRFASGYAIQVFDGERKIYSRDDELVPDANWIHEGELQFHDVRWRVRIWPTPAFVALQSSWLPWAVLGVGILVAVLLALITLLSQVANARAQALRVEIGERIKVEQENALLISELEVVFENVIVGIALIKDRHTVRCNLQYAQILGDQMERVVGQPVGPNHPSEAVAREMGGAVEDALAAGQSFTVDLELPRPDGSRFWAACFGKALDPNDIRKGTVWVLEDISGRKSAEEQLIFQAQHDALTGLANRTMLADRLNMAINHAARHKHQMAICYLDLDKFKYVNDTFGHETGDQLLLTVAQRLLGSVRDTDTVARLGGDEFAIVLFEGVDPNVVAAVLTRILDNIGARLDLNGHQLAVSGSIGVAIYPEHGLDAQTLLQHADEAMYFAKQAGRNNWRAYSPDQIKPVDIGIKAAPGALA